MTSEKPPALIVESEQITRKVLGTYLAVLGYQVTNAASAHEAMALAQSVRFQVLLADMHLLDRSGWDLLWELQMQDLLPPLSVSMSQSLSLHD